MVSAIKAKVEALMSSTTLPHPLGVVQHVGDDVGVVHHVDVVHHVGVVHHVDEVNLLHDGGGDGKCN